MTELIDSVLVILRQSTGNCKNVFHKISDQAKNEREKYDAPHFWFPEDAKVTLSEIIILLMTLRIFFPEAIFVPYLDHLIVEMEDRLLDQKHKCRRLWGLTYVCFLETVFGRSALRRLRAAASSSGLKGPEILFPSGARTFHRSDSSLLTSLVDSRLLLV